MSIDNFFKFEPYSLNKNEKEVLLSNRLKELCLYHYEQCDNYKNIIDFLCYNTDQANTYYDLPFIPTRLFKNIELKSVKVEDITKTMTSSGTTGQTVSRIFVDKVTAANQQKAMVKIVSDFIGKNRLPMIIIDTESVLKDRNMFTARGAGILGFSLFANKKIFAFDNDMNLNLNLIMDFLTEHKDERILLFGFTYMIWQYFYKKLIENNITINLENGILIHGGGWKKLISESVSKDEFKRSLNNVCAIDVKNIHDYYGMVEQTGCIYMECEHGHLHASNFSDVIIRNPIDFSICKTGEKGIIEVVSSLPESYPGHILLTEDEGVILGEDDCPCGRKGKYFSVLGRLKDAEVRGCSDTYEKY